MRRITKLALVLALTSLNISMVSVVNAEPETKKIYVNRPLVIREAPKEVEIINHHRQVSEREYELLERVCMSEAGNQPLAGKIAVLETILNRVDLGFGTIEEVVTAPNQYSIADNGKPNKECTKAVEIVLKNSDMFDDNMLYFRTGYYHNFGTPYMQIGAHYFSLRE